MYVTTASVVVDNAASMHTGHGEYGEEHGARGLCGHMEGRGRQRDRDLPTLQCHGNATAG